MDTTLPSSSASWWKVGLFGLLLLAFVGSAGYAVYTARETFLASAPLWLWLSLIGTLATIVAIDLGVNLRSKRHEVSFWNAVGWSVIWLIVMAVYGLFIAWARSDVTPWTDTFSLYFTGWTLEMTQSLDNLFAIGAIFAAFSLVGAACTRFQLKILYAGIIGMIVFRGFFLCFGALFLHLPKLHIGVFEISYVLILLGLLVGATVRKMLKDEEEDGEVDYPNHWSVRYTRWFLPVDPSLGGGRFFTRQGVTVLFLCALVVEIMDFVFAFDSMPVIISVVKDPFLMAASNLMACAGLRSLFFVVEALKSKLWAVPKAVIYVLVFVVVSLFIEGFDLKKVVPFLETLTSPTSTLIVIGTLIGVGVLVSLVKRDPDADEAEAA